MNKLQPDIEKQLLDLKDQYFNCKLNDIEYRNAIKKVLKYCRVKLLPSKTAQVFFVDTDIYLQIDDWDGIKYKKSK